MLHSMTGYGRAAKTFGDKTITIEVRSVNAKMSDIRFKMPNAYKDKELELRRILAETAERGKIDVNIHVKSLAGDDDFVFNHTLFERYYNELNTLADQVGAPKSDILSAILRLPNIVGAEEISVADDEWAAAQQTLQDALRDFTHFRATEGAALELDLRERLRLILDLLTQVAPYERERVTKLRERMKKHLEEFMLKENVDQNRFEQEVLFYIEKIDITEEKVRLEQHCKYFHEQLDDPKTSSKGRTLNFIAQEIGREINTLGSKAYSSDIQKIVVQMKDELEKMKEQIANLV